MSVFDHTPTRRLVLAAAGFSLIGGPVRADDFEYKGWRFKTRGVGGRVPDASVQSFQAQIDIVESLAIKPDIKAFFRGVPIEVVPTTPRGPGVYEFDQRILFLSVIPDPPENPIFLHELLHAYHDQRLQGGRRNPQVIAFYDAARRAKDFPDRAYMYSNPTEFFAMCASVVLWGRAAREPFTRANVREKFPALHDWIVTEFGLAET